MWQKVAKFKGAEYFRKALYLHVCYVHKTQASLLSLESVSKQLEAGLSPIEIHFYGMVCLSL